jgi:SAM-dependent methyltransferase
MTVEYLPSVSIEGHQTSSTGGPDHPMRVATRRAAGLDADGWTRDLRDDVRRFFDDLAGEWDTRTSPQRTAIVRDAINRGFGRIQPIGDVAIEIGSGTGAYSALLAERFNTVLAVDLSLAMLRQAPRGPAQRMQADGSRLPIRDGVAAVVVLINALLFPREVERVLSARGVLLWVNSSGEQTPIYLPTDDLVRSLSGKWTGVASRAGVGQWCVLQRASSA